MIRIIKLTTGEEIVAQTTVSAGNDCHHLKNPVRVMYVETGVRMIPFCLLAKDNEITIQTQHIIYSVEANDELTNAYNSQFGSGIVIPNQTNLIH